MELSVDLLKCDTTLVYLILFHNTVHPRESHPQLCKQQAKESHQEQVPAPIVDIISREIVGVDGFN